MTRMIGDMEGIVGLAAPSVIYVGPTWHLEPGRPRSFCNCD
jgi:hypothetical protein